MAREAADRMRVAQGESRSNVEESTTQGPEMYFLDCEFIPGILKSITP